MREHNMQQNISSFTLKNVWPNIPLTMVVKKKQKKQRCFDLTEKLDWHDTVFSRSEGRVEWQRHPKPYDYTFKTLKSRGTSTVTILNLIKSCCQMV